MATVDTEANTLTDPHGPPAATGSWVGRRFAHFQIEKKLGAGGMGEVWRAHDMALDRPVAIKVLSEDLAASPVARERFRREARAQARVYHPNIGHIYFVGEQEGLLFFAMELIGGESLQQRLDREGKLPPGEAVDLIRQAALGLREAHKHGFTHRDIKPSNLMVDAHGVVKLVDFGLVKRVDPPAGEIAATAETTTLLGTPLYMSPEQARGEAVDFRSDIYALGVTLHQLIAGKPPFSGTTPMAIVSQHLADPRPPLDVGKKEQGLLVDELCARMMAKRPDDRFASYEELIAAIERLSPRITRPAGGPVRLAAFAIDMALVLAATWAGDELSPAPWLSEIWSLVALTYFVVGYAYGRTPGMMAFELELVAASGGGHVGWRRAAMRFAALFGPNLLADYGARLAVALPAFARIPLVLVLFLGSAIPIVVSALRTMDGRRAYWDRLAGTRVVYRRHV